MFEAAYLKPPVALSPQLVVEPAQLAEEADVGPDLPLPPEEGERLRRRHVPLDHKEGGHDGGRPGVAQQAVDEDEAVAEGERAVDELGAVAEVLVDVRLREVGEAEALVRYALFGEPK